MNEKKNCKLAATQFNGGGGNNDNDGYTPDSGIKGYNFFIFFVLFLLLHSNCSRNGHIHNL